MSRNKCVERHELDGYHHDFHGKRRSRGGKQKMQVGSETDTRQFGARGGKWCKVLPSTGWKSAAEPLLALTHSFHVQAFLTPHTLSSVEGWEMLLAAN